MNPSNRPYSPLGIPDLILEKLHLAELNEADVAQLNSLGQAEKEAKLAHQKNLMALTASDKTILEEYPPDFVVSQIGKRMLRKVHRLNLFGVFLESLIPRATKPSIALATLAILLVPMGVFMFTNDSDTVRTKGLNPFITVYRKAGDSFERLSSDTSVKERDVLQLSYVAHDTKFGAIFSIDGNGKLTLHYPEKVGSAAKLVTSGEVILPNAFELDNSPRFERFVFITSQASFDTGEVFEILQKLKITEKNIELKLPNQLTAFSVLLRK